MHVAKMDLDRDNIRFLTKMHDQKTYLFENQTGTFFLGKWNSLTRTSSREHTYGWQSQSVKMQDGRVVFDRLRIAL